MKNVYIKYNPYKLTTEVLIDGKEVKKNSRLNISNEHLQEWVDKLPEFLEEECRTNQINLEFCGTELDYEDVLEAAKEAAKRGLQINVTHIPVKEIEDKEKLITDIFEEIKEGPFEELKQPDVIRAFELAKSSDFEVNVVATMSAGKSTLINALLGQRLMPAKNEACTATITRIKDDDSEKFTATVYDTEGDIVETQEHLTYEIMDRLNSDENVSEILVSGNIPFVNANDVSLVLVDTPGPNNSRNSNHKKATYQMLSKSSKTVVLYIMNATQLSTNDDNNLLNYVSESMKVGGKQSRDRFIFVVNKLDNFGKEDSIESALEKVKEYLADHGIENPNIYPTSALAALDIRTTLAESDDDDDDDVYEAKGRVRKFNRNEELHFENYVPLPAAARGKIANRLNRAIQEDNRNEQALIHSGIVPLEEAIRMYVLKYAEPTKIKNIVDTFEKKLESAKSFDNAKKEISENKAKREEIRKEIQNIEKKLKNGEDAKHFKDEIERLNYDKEIKKRANQIVKKAQTKLTPYLTGKKDSTNEDNTSISSWGAIAESFTVKTNEPEKISLDAAKNVIEEFGRFTNDLQAEVQVDLEDLINNSVRKSAEDLLNQYKEKLAGLTEELSVDGLALNPFEMMEGDMSSIKYKDIISDSIEKEEVVVGQKEERNTNKRWFKPWTWFEPKYYIEDETEEREYVNKEKLAQKFFAPIQESLYKNSESAQNYAKESTKEIKEYFSKKFDELDELLQEKLNDLKKYTSDEEKAQLELEKVQNRLNWLNKIQDKINKILEI